MSTVNLIYLWCGLVGVVLGWALHAGYTRSVLHRLELRESKALALATERLNRLSTTEQSLQQQLAEKYSLRTAVDTARARLQQQQVASRQQAELLEKRNQELKQQIEAISARVFADNTHRMTQQTETHLQHLLKPLREQLGAFKQRVEEVYDKEQQDRYQLQAEISQLKNLNERISTDAINLSNALRGNNKTLGGWGELVLERVFERAGLNRGREYDREVSLKQSDGTTLRPDALLYLPGDKTIVIDSKVSIRFYEKSLNDSCDKETRNRLMREHVKSIKKHVDGLSAKQYERLEGINSLDFVLMFLPVEAALQSALEFDESLYKEAYDNNIVLVGPASLMVACRTIQNVWRSELQDKNSRIIAKRAGELIDRFNGFVTEIDNISVALDNAAQSCNNARRKLVTGRGNLVERARQLKQLGATGKSENHQVQKNRSRNSKEAGSDII